MIVPRWTDRFVEVPANRIPFSPPFFPSPPPPFARTNTHPSRRASPVLHVHQPAGPPLGPPYLDRRHRSLGGSASRQDGRRVQTAYHRRHPVAEAAVRGRPIGQPQPIPPVTGVQRR